MPSYSPFDKSLWELEASDLASLKSATEGWYVEYKREASKADTMAKSVSAFANTHGGWLFYGVTEKSKDEAVAGEFPGIAKAGLSMFWSIAEAYGAPNCWPNGDSASNEHLSELLDLGGKAMSAQAAHNARRQV